MEENKNKIYRNLPDGYNKNQDFLDRREKVYNPHPLSNQRTSDSYYTIKNELSSIQAIDIVNKLKSKVEYFMYKDNLYKLTELPLETMYKNLDKSKKLISDQKLFSSNQKSFLDEHLDYLNDIENKKSKIGLSLSQDKTVFNPNPTLDSNDPNSSKLKLTANFFVSNELSGLKELKYEDLLKEHQIILKKLFYYFILKFNIEVKKSGYDLPYHQPKNYRITDYQIIKIQYHKELNLYLYTFICEVFRENKHYGFSIYLEMFYRAEKNKIWINKSHLMGIVPQSDLVFKQFGTYNFNNKNNNKNNNLTSFPISDKPDQSILDDLYTKMQNFNFRDQNNQSLSYNIQLRDFDLNAGHKCFKPNGDEYPDAKTSNDCLSIDPNIKQTGVWDRECQKDEDCPFFQANKNYPNNFGGCKVGKCELPVGMNRIGFKHYNKDKPICYNCNLKDEIMTADGYSVVKERKCSGIECNKCCDIQHKKNIYPDLKSPDFVFENDQIERSKHKELLQRNGLGVDNLIIT
jgi:hypothetical protein